MDEAERRRIDEHIYPRPPADILDGAARAGLRDPSEQMWIRGGLSDERPRTFRCGFHTGATRDPGPVPVIDLTGLDGKTYRVGQCRRCGRIFWGVKR